MFISLQEHIFLLKNIQILIHPTPKPFFLWNHSCYFIRVSKEGKIQKVPKKSTPREAIV